MRRLRIGSKVSTFYGDGKLQEINGAIATVCLPYGTAYTHVLKVRRIKDKRYYSPVFPNEGSRHRHMANVERKRMSLEKQLLAHKTLMENFACTNLMHTVRPSCEILAEFRGDNGILKKVESGLRNISMEISKSDVGVDYKQLLPESPGKDYPLPKDRNVGVEEKSKTAQEGTKENTNNRTKLIRLILDMQMIPEYVSAHRFQDAVSIWLKVSKTVGEIEAEDSPVRLEVEHLRNMLIEILEHGLLSRSPSWSVEVKLLSMLASLGRSDRGLQLFLSRRGRETEVEIEGVPLPPKGSGEAGIMLHWSKLVRILLFSIPNAFLLVRQPFKAIEGTRMMMWATEQIELIVDIFAAKILRHPDLTPGSVQKCLKELFEVCGELKAHGLTLVPILRRCISKPLEEYVEREFHEASEHIARVVLGDRFELTYFKIKGQYSAAPVNLIQSRQSQSRQSSQRSSPGYGVPLSRSTSDGATSNPTSSGFGYTGTRRIQVDRRETKDGKTQNQDVAKMSLLRESQNLVLDADEDSESDVTPHHWSKWARSVSEVQRNSSVESIESVEPRHHKNTYRMKGYLKRRSSDTKAFQSSAKRNQLRGHTSVQPHRNDDSSSNQIVGSAMRHSSSAERVNIKLEQRRYLCSSGLALYHALEPAIRESSTLMDISGLETSNLPKKIAQRAISMVEGYTLTISELLVDSSERDYNPLDRQNFPGEREPAQASTFLVNSGQGSLKGRRSSDTKHEHQSFSTGSGKGSWALVRKWAEDFGKDDKASTSNRNLSGPSALAIVCTLKCISSDLAPRLALVLPKLLSRKSRNVCVESLSALQQRLEGLRKGLHPSLGIKLYKEFFPHFRDWDADIWSNFDEKGHKLKGIQGPFPPKRPKRYHTELCGRLALFREQMFWRCNNLLEQEEASSIANHTLALAIISLLHLLKPARNYVTIAQILFDLNRLQIDANGPRLSSHRYAWDIVEQQSDFAISGRTELDHASRQFLNKILVSESIELTSKQVNSLRGWIPGGSFRVLSSTRARNRKKIQRI